MPHATIKPNEREPEHCWFCYDPDTGFEVYRTRQEAIDAAVECIEEYCADNWSDEVESVCIGSIEMRATKVNVVTKDMLDSDGCYNGRHYYGNYDEWCNYELR